MFSQQLIVCISLGLASADVMPTPVQRIIRNVVNPEVKEDKTMMRKRSRVAPNSSDSLSELRAVSNQTDSFAKGFFGNIINPVARDAQTRSMMRKRGGNQTATSSLAEAEVVEQTNVTSSANSSFAQRLKNNIVNHIVNPASRAADDQTRSMMRKRGGNKTTTSSLAEVVEQANLTSSANSSFAQRLKNNIVNHIVNPASRDDDDQTRSMMRKRGRNKMATSSLAEIVEQANLTSSANSSFAQRLKNNIVNHIINPASREDYDQKRSMMRKRGRDKTTTSSLAEAEVVEQANLTSSANSSFAQRLKNNIVNHIVNPASREDKTMMRKRSGTTDIVPTSLAQKEYDDQEAVGDSAVSRLKPDVQAIEGVSADAEVSVQETATRSEVPMVQSAHEPLVADFSADGNVVFEDTAPRVTMMRKRNKK